MPSSSVPPGRLAEGPPAGDQAHRVVVGARRLDAAGDRPGLFPGARGQTDLVQRVQGTGARRPGRRSRRRRHDHPRHAQEARRRRGRLYHHAHRRSEARRGAGRSRREVQRRNRQPLAARSARLGRAPAAARGLVVVLLQADGRRRRRRDVVRAQQGQDLRRRRRQDDVPGRGRCRRSGAGAARDRRVPEDAEEVHQPRRQDSEGRAAGRPAGHRQDPAGARGGRRSQGAVLQPERLGVRRDVRRRRRGPRARPVRAGRSQGAVHRLHRRARRARQGARAEPARQPRRARANAQPAAGRNGRLRRAQGDHHHGGHQPPRGARPGADAARAVRSAGAGRQARREGPRRGAADPRPQRQARRRRSTCARSRPARRDLPAPTWRTSSTRRRCSPPAATPSSCRCATSTRRSIG